MAVAVFPRRNNLQWLRLLFALQVVVMHSADHLGLPATPWFEHFPGVPAFFFVSGFLIYASWCNSPGKHYFENRFYRLWPGLVFVALGGVAVAIAAHGWGDLATHPVLYGTWFIAQVTLGQAFNPAHFRDIGIGVINGALWTITTEILFYLAVPVIAWMERRFSHTVPAFTIASFAVFALGQELFSGLRLGGKSLFEYLALTPVVWGWMFGFGILAVKHFDVLSRWIRYFPLAGL